MRPGVAGLTASHPSVGGALAVRRASALAAHRHDLGSRQRAGGRLALVARLAPRVWRWRVLGLVVRSWHGLSDFSGCADDGFPNSKQALRFVWHKCRLINLALVTYCNAEFALHDVELQRGRQP